jgi:hypothetical protein
MKWRLRATAAIAGATMALWATSAAQATVLTWHLEGVQFDDGTLASGTFAFNAAVGSVGAFTDWNISVLAGSFLPAFNYSTVNSGPGFHTLTQIDFVPDGNPPARYLRLDFTSPLTDVGGTVELKSAGASWECTNCAARRYIVDGAVTTLAATVPEPASYALALAGLGLLGLVSRRRRV